MVEDFRLKVASRYTSVIGLAFGDCGKGRFVDELCARQGAGLVVRFSGGGQAGHTVCRTDGRQHTFAQLGAGSFNPRARTLLASPMVVHPGGLLREAEALARQGTSPPLQRLHIDARCKITTPFLQAAGRLRELARKEGAHGTCGVGVGETVRLALEQPELSIHYGELRSGRGLLEKLEAQREALEAQLPRAGGKLEEKEWREWQVLRSRDLAGRWQEQILPLCEQVPATSQEEVAELLARAEAVIFEGSQGLLLDEDLGFHPHTTWSRVGPKAAEAVLEDAGITARIEHLGVLRTYLTRHGQGPFPTEDVGLSYLPEPHNLGQGWQGSFRRGHPDAVLLRYALSAAEGKFSGLLVSHLDALADGANLRWCEAYTGPDGQQVPELPRPKSLKQQEKLTRLLFGIKPLYGARIAGAEAFLAELEQLAGIPVVLTSQGPTSNL